MKVHALGVRGSTPTPGPQFLGYGGNTSCVAVAHDKASEPCLVLDAGTGIRGLSELLEGAAFSGSIVLTHLHWDHTQGLPFFSGGDRPDARVDIYVPVEEGDDALGVLSLAMSPPSFPIRPDELLGSWRFHPLRPGELSVDGFSVTVRPVPHKGGLTMGIRVDDGHSTLAYLPDHGPSANAMEVTHPDSLALVAGVDLLIHDAHHTEDELRRWAHFGHSSADQALQLAEAGAVRRLVLSHHSPTRGDTEVEALLRHVQSKTVIPVEAATEGQAWHLP